MRDDVSLHILQEQFQPRRVATVVAGKRDVCSIGCSLSRERCMRLGEGVHSIDKIAPATEGGGKVEVERRGG